MAEVVPAVIEAVAEVTRKVCAADLGTHAEQESLGLRVSWKTPSRPYTRRSCHSWSTLTKTSDMTMSLLPWSTPTRHPGSASQTAGTSPARWVLLPSNAKPTEAIASAKI